LPLRAPVSRRVTDATWAHQKQLSKARAVAKDPDATGGARPRSPSSNSQTALEGWLVPGRNAFGLYLYLENVDGLAAALQDLRSGRRGPEDKPWGMYEFAIPDPDETLVRIGWPTRLRDRADEVIE
jgi:hypothetical protein